MVTKEDVIAAYRLILGREPESRAAIEAHLSAESLPKLREKFLNSQEFIRHFGAGFANIDDHFPSQIMTPIRVDTVANSDEQARLHTRIRQEWESFGQSEPHWSVLTHEEYKQNLISENREQFFESGEYVCKILKSASACTDIVLPAEGTCLELGCGVGRITMHLAKMFKSIIAVDISQYHLDICGEELKRAGVENVRLLHLSALDNLEQLPTFNCFVSFIVLQHNPPPVIAYTLNVMLSKLERNGVALFQVPTHRQGYQFDLKNYLDNPGPLTMEMHVLPQLKVFEIISKNHCQPLYIREDGWADGRTQECISNTFFLKKL